MVVGRVDVGRVVVGRVVVGGVVVGGVGEGHGPDTAACTVRLRLKVPLSTYVWFKV